MIIKKHQILTTLWLLALLPAWGCGGEGGEGRGTNEQTSKLHHQIVAGVSLAKLEQMVVQTQRLVIVNLTTSRSTYLYEGKTVDSWNSVTADITGTWHKRDGVKIPKHTPEGVYSIHTIEHCPIWRPASPKDPKTKKRAENEAHRQRIFVENPKIYGPCGELNPLGEYVAWFYGAYGWHGSAVLHHWRFVSELPLRRASGGCIRNPQHKTRRIFGHFLEHPALRDFGQLVKQNAALETPQNLVQSQVDILADMKIVVGHFPHLSYELEEEKDPILEKLAQPKESAVP